MIPVRMWWSGGAMKVLLHVIRQFRRLDWEGSYIYDLPGVGTSFIVANECTRLGFQKVYMPLPRTFFIGHYERSVYDCVLFEAFYINRNASNVSQIKRLLERACFAVDAKYRERRISVKCPLLFVSSYIVFL